MSFLRKDKWTFRRTKWEIRKLVIVFGYAGSSAHLPPLSAPEESYGNFTLSFLPGSEAAPKRFTVPPFLEVSAFSQIMEAPKVFFLDQVNLKCLSLK